VLEGEQVADKEVNLVLKVGIDNVRSNLFYLEANYAYRIHE